MLSTVFRRSAKGAEIEMSARVFFPDGTPLDSLILMDLECASCGLDTNPGIRLYLRKGLLRVDRSKIGIKEPFYPETFNALGTGAWHEIAWHVTLGEGQKGRSIVYLDGAEVSDARGTTVLTQAVVSQLADIRVKEQADRFQVGITANSNPRAAVMLLDDVGFCVR